MPAMRKCRGCGADVPNNAPFGHCPKCLLELGFGPLPEATEAPSPSPIPGARRFGDYELLDQIGRGGMGIIYKARQTTLNRLVALKMIRAAEFASPTLIQRFHLEAEAAANLHHPNIVPIYETGEHQGEHFFSMGLVDGFGLDRYITSAGFCFGRKEEGIKPSVRERQEQIARLMAKVARAVDYAHQHGVLHRDLKPANILLDCQGEPHLTDFGVAKVIGQSGYSLTLTGAIIGTPSYMAPEQAAGQSKRATTAADIYSLGAILYEMLTGQPPFRADTPVETLKQVVEQEPKHPTTFKEGVDRDLATISMKCLEKEPQRRYNSAAALADELERWLRREPILAQPVGPVGKVWRWCRREPAVATLGAVIVLCLTAATLAALVAYRNADAAAASERQRREEAEKNQRDLAEVARRQTDLELERLNSFYENPAESSVVIPSAQLALLNARLWDSNGLSIRFGVYTHVKPAQMFRKFAPLLAYLETNVTELPLRIDLVIYKGYSNLVEALVRGEVDFARPGPASYVLARQRNSTIYLLAKQLHDGQAIINGLIFTRADSTLQGLENLEGKPFAFGDPDSTFGNYASKAALLDAGIRRTNLGSCPNLGTHTYVAKVVNLGAYAAGAANSNVVWSEFGGRGLKILHSMSSVSFPWVASTNLPPVAARAITKHLLKIQAPHILTNIDIDLTGFTNAAPDDYNEFEQQINRAADF